MTDHEIVLAIQELLDSVEWTADTLQDIAELFEQHLKDLLWDRSAIDLVHDIPDLYPIVARALKDDVLESIQTELEMAEEERG